MASTMVRDSAATRDWKIEHAGRIPQIAFKTVIGLFCGIAVISVVGRVIIRVTTRKRLYLDDYLLIFGVLCLGAATGLVFTFCHIIFLSNALRLDSTIFPTGNEITQLIGSLKIIYSFLNLIWTTTYAVKLSFLAFFRHLIHHVSRPLTIFYWTAVTFTVLCWMFLMGEPFILCPYFGLATLKCLPETPYVLTISLTVFITIIDIITDIMIVTIPIIILRKAKIRLSQKVGLGIFLCLSFVMVTFALTRVSAYRLNGVIDLTWQIFWQYMEGCIAVIMASVTTFRNVFIAAGSRRSRKRPQGPSSRQRMLARLQRKDSQSTAGSEGLPAIPRATLLGMRTFIRQNNRSTPGTTMKQSELDPSETEYHAFRKAERQGIRINQDWEVHSHGQSQQSQQSASVGNSSNATTFV